MLHLHKPTAGSVEVAGQRLDELSKSELRKYRRHMQIVFQDPTSSLNPRKRVRQIITEPMRIHDIGTQDERLERAEELLDIVGLPREYLHRYPNALSGGQKQRVGIARAVAVNPDFVVLDEPTSALDVSVQARIVDLFEDLQTQFDLTYLFITHDLSLVRNIADWIGVMYLGQLVEVGPTRSVFRNPQHPYTRALLSAIPTIDEADERLKPGEIILEGEVPDPREKPSGCGFRSRCPHEFPACADHEPGFYQVDESHYTRCFLHDEGHNEGAVPW
jgi:oligopeptide transport system ATP-binding protein